MKIDDNVFFIFVACVPGYQNIRISGGYLDHKTYQWVLKEFLDHSMPSINDLSDGTHFVTDQTHFAGGAFTPLVSQ